MSFFTTCANYFRFTLLSLIFFSPSLMANGPDKVKTYQDAQGWKLQVNGEDFYVKGVVWGYTPRNENYSFNLWGKTDEEIKKVLDNDFTLMRKAGVNAIRAFSEIPPKWVMYIKEKYGIMTAINPLMGRYGATIGGKWIVNTDYSDPLTRKTLKKEVLDVIRKFKGVPGVLMYALGNESNYGLSWSSFEIENLPEGEQNAAKAEFLYSLYAEIINEARKIDPGHPITIVNGDIQYLNLIAKYGKDWELLGVNAYRGENFTSMWKDVKAGLGLPILFFEFGSDAFNAKTYEEDQASQAYYLKKQWQDMYSQAHGHGYGNSIGGFIFQWRDEWWKYKQTENLDKHDRTASWGNGGYKFDYTPGKNNMNEEWWGITRLGDRNEEGVYIAEPRMAYDVLTEVWKIDPLASTPKAINTDINTIDMQKIAVQVNKRDKENDWGESSNSFNFDGGSLTLDVLSKGYDTFNPIAGKTAKTITDKGQKAFLDFSFNNRRFSGSFRVNVIPNSIDSDFEFRYGDRLNDVNGNRIELYNFESTYIGEEFDVNVFYHVPRYHWGDEGDFFGLMREATDMDGPNGPDIWNAKPPFGVELVGKHDQDGFKMVAGDEIYWGANPKVMIKHQFGESKQYTVVFSHEYDTRDGGEGSSTDVASAQTQQLSLQGKFNFDNGMELELGGLISGDEKINRTYDYYKNGQPYRSRIKFIDTLALKGKLTFDLLDNISGYAGFHFAGLIADGGAQHTNFGTQLPYSERGNKRVIEGGLRITQGNYMIFPRLMYRDNLLDANPLVNARIVGTTLFPGIVPRNTDDDPFAVLSNREARAAEIFLTYDPTPGTFFYEWDNDTRENASFAYNAGFTYIDYRKPTDANLFFYEAGGVNAAFASGLEADELWMFTSKMVFNPNPGFKAIVKFSAGKQQPTGVPDKAIKYHDVNGKFIVNQKNIFNLSYAKDKWGPYDFQRQFNVTYPEQWKFEYTRLLDNGLTESESSKIGIKAFYRTLDAGSPGEWTTVSGGKTIFNDSMYEIQAYYTYKF